MAEIPSYLQPNAAPVTPEAAAPVATLDGTTPHVDVAQGQASEQVFDVRNKTTINIPRSEVELAVRSGLYIPLDDKEFVINDIDGKTHAVNGKNLKQAFDDGNTFASEEDSHAHLTKRKYGNSEVLAGLEGFNRGALPGIADRLTEGTKNFSGAEITQEDLAGRAEANPISAGIGELAGTVMSPIMKVLGPGSKAVEAGVAKTLTKFGAKAGLTNKVAQAIVSKIIPAAAGSAVEGAYFGAAHLLNEDALGNAQFNAENLLASAEQGALWGAAFGGSLSAAGQAISGTAGAIGRSSVGQAIGAKADDMWSSLNNTEKAAREFLGLKPGMVKKLADTDAAFMDDAIKYTQEVLGKNGKVVSEDMAGIVGSDLTATGKKIGSAISKVDDVSLANGANHVIKPDDLNFKIASRIESEVLPGLKKVAGAVDEVKAANKMINDVLNTGVGQDVQQTAKSLHDRLRQVDDMIYTEEGVLKSKTLKSKMLRIQRGVIREELDGAVALAEKAHPTELAGVSSELAQANRRYRTLSSLTKAVKAQEDAGIMSNVMSKTDMAVGGLALGVGGVSGGASAAAVVVAKKFAESDMLRKMQILGKIERAQQATQATVTKAFKAMGTAVDVAAPRVKLVATKSLVDSAVATELVDGKKRKPKDEQQAYRNINANAKFASENPEQFLQGVNKYSSHLYAVAPKTSGALDTAALNAMLFIHSKAPTSNKSKGFFDAHKVDKASGHEMLKMQQRMDIISTPSKAIQLMGKGKLGASHVETLKAVYPEMHAELQKQAMNFLSSKDAAKLTYGQKLNMATLLDVQADESMHFDSVMGLQANFSSGDDAGAAGGVVNSTQGGLAKVSKASRMDMDDSNDG